jgi:glyoxylase-like metal-dependent hydrolase (beta-lactamase superfamily II)
MSAALAIGDIQLSFVSGGHLRIDGGNMFGVVPRLLWERESPPDDQHRISLDTNCVLVRTPESLGLIDTGYGSKSPPKFRQRHALEDGAPLVRNLAAIGVNPSDLDWVILTHLHFDHAGGATYRDADGQLQPTFPRAGLLHPIEGDTEVVPGVSTQVTGGHTRGHQIIHVQSRGESAVCLADLCPTASHLRSFWTMAYDQYPLTVRHVKPIVINEMVDQHRIALFSHDPQITAARLSRKTDNEWIAAPIG